MSKFPPTPERVERLYVLTELKVDPADVQEQVCLADLGLPILDTVEGAERISMMVEGPPELADLRSAEQETVAGLRRLQPHLLPLRPSERSLRSEEHTSELQSRENLVCRLLLE